jgi:hypothetical protein
MIALKTSHKLIVSGGTLELEGTLQQPREIVRPINRTSTAEYNSLQVVSMP